MSTRTITDTQFDHLLVTWNQHQDKRRSGGPIAELLDSRVALDEARRLVRS